MAYINTRVEINLDEFDDKELFEGTINRIKLLKRDGEQINEDTIKDFLTEIGFITRYLSPNLSKVDDWKDELWPILKEKYTLEQLEKLSE